MIATPEPVAESSVRFRRSVLATCCIPWRDDDTFDEPRFRRTVVALCRRGLTDLYIFGTAGEGHAVADRQFAAITDVFIDETRQHQATAMIGVIALSTRTVIERIELAADLGAREFQLTLPNWGAVNDRELQTFFRETCGRFAELAFLHYNLPRAGRIVTPCEYAELAAEHPNLVATKYGAGHPEVVAGLLEQAPMLRHFFTELGFFVGAPLGPCGLLASIASTNPRRAHDYLAAAVHSDWETVTSLYRELAAMMTGLRAAVGPGSFLDGAYDKILLQLSDPDFPRRLLPPYEPAPDEALARYREVLANRFPAWLPPENTE